MLSGFAANPGVPNAATGDAAAKVLARHPSALLVRCRECDVLDRRLQIEQGRVARRVLRSAIEQRMTGYARNAGGDAARQFEPAMPNRSPMPVGQE